MTYHVVRVDPYHPGLGVLAPMMAARMVEYAQSHTPEVNAGEFTAGFMSQLWGRDPSVLLLAVVNDKGQPFGHVAAVVKDHGAEKWGMIVQTKQDTDVGDAMSRAMDEVGGWAKAEGASKLLLSYHRADAKWQKRYGFKTHRYLMVKDL